MLADRRTISCMSRSSRNRGDARCRSARAAGPKQPSTRGGANQRELQRHLLYTDRALGPLTDDDVELVILHRRVEDLSIAGAIL